MNPLRSLIDAFVAWNSKGRYRSREEVAQLLHDVADGAAKHGKVDGFIYIPIIDPELERIRKEFGLLYGPGFDAADPRFVSLIQQADALACS